MSTGGLTRRGFLAAGLGTLAVASRTPAKQPTAERCVMVVLTGGPSHIDTFDPKPDAASSVRSPFGTIRTRVPGLFVTELLPGLADRANRVAVIRSIHHNEPPLHEVGLQLLQTGRFVARGSDGPHVGAQLAHSGLGPWYLMPGPIGDTGLAIGKGQSYGHSTTTCAPITTGSRDFVSNCGEAIRLVEGGASLVCINMFTDVFHVPTWDCHADEGRLATTLLDYRHIAPTFDRGFALLLDGLQDRGLLDSTLVIAAGEFGRTPHINPRGGRDHWAGCWSALMAGGGIRGGIVYGSSDAIGAEPKDHAVTPANLAATVMHACGLEGRIDDSPMYDLFG